jgi:hypothetical protein
VALDGSIISFRLRRGYARKTIAGRTSPTRTAENSKKKRPEWFSGLSSKKARFLTSAFLILT